MPTAVVRADPTAHVAALVRDPVHFCRALLRRDLWSTQEAILRAVATRSRIAVKACHASGKSFVAAAAVLWFTTRYRDGVVVTTAPTWTQVENVLWGEIHKAVQHGRIAYPALSRTELRLGPGNYAIGLSTNEGVRFQGFHGRVLLVIDEAPGVRPDIWEAIEGIRAGGDVRVLALGNPTLSSGPFYDAFTATRAGWSTFTISAFDSPNLAGLSLDDLLALSDPELDWNGRPYLVTRRWVREKYDEWGLDHPLWAARVCGEFPAQSDDALISLAWLEAAARLPTADTGGPVTAGLDVAGPGEAETALVVAEGPHILAQHAWAQSDPRGAVAAALAPYRSRLEAVNVDSVGIGHYLAKHLEDLGYPARFVNVGEVAGDRERFRNLKAQFFWNLRLRFQQGDIAGLTDARTIGQLAGIRYKHNARGQVEIESKDDARKRGVKSPDRAEAVMLTFARPAVGQLLFADEIGNGELGSRSGRPASWVQQIVHAMPEYFDRGAAANPAMQCGTCVNRTVDGWCRLRQFTVAPALPACEFYEPIPASRFGPGT
jgi:phage terminase large subunit